MRLMDLLGCVGWAGFFVSALAWLPFFGPLLSLLAPLPFLYYAVKLGLLEGVKLTVCSLILLGLFAGLTGHPHAILYCLQFSLLGLALSEIFRRRLTLGYTILFGTAFMLSLGFAFLLIIADSKNMGPFEMLLEYLRGNLKEAVEIYKGMGADQKRASELLAFQKVFLDTVSKIYPSLMILGTGFVVWLNVVVSKTLFRMKKIPYPDFVSMGEWRAPESLVWVVIAAGFALFLLEGGIRLLAINTVIIMMGVYLFQGLSILVFFLNKYRAPSWVRAGVYFLIIFQQFFLAILAFAGLFDQWIDFRRIHKRMRS